MHARLVAGDEHALSDLYDAFSSMVFGIAFRITSDRTASEDVTQEVFVQVWQRPQGFSPERGSLRSWIGTIAHRRAVDYVRHEESLRRRTRLKASQRTLTEFEWKSPDEEETNVRKAFSGLPSEQREVIELAYFRGRTFRQVASDLGIPEGTAKSRLRLALSRMERVLSKEVAR